MLSSIFGQFGTSCFFRSSEPAVAKLISEMCGTETIIKQQKNTSFGANSFRDGISYNQQELKQNIVELNDLAKLNIGECFTMLPNPDVRIAKINIPQDIQQNKNIHFVQKQLFLTDTK